MTTALDVLEHVFGYQAFRSPQADIIDTLRTGDDALVIMPTGGGKSLCYQIPALLREGTAVVISPLIALMEDQVKALQELGVKAGYLNSSLELQQVRDIESALQRGELDLLYIAPERLIQERSLNLLKNIRIALFAIDEAHCVSQWGHDFRADYLKLSLLQENFPDVPRIALTATADERTRHEIIQRLGLQQAKQFISGFDRPNIQYRIQQKQNARKQVLKFLREEQQGHAGIIYCLSRKKVEQTAEWLNREGYTALAYHAGMPAQTRQQNQARFLRDDNIIMVATIAFGMGIDKPDVRFVIHMDMPKSIEAYYQETGRAGRDGDKSTVLLLYGLEDVVKLKQMMQQSEGSEEFKRSEAQKLNAMLGLCEITACRRKALLHYFNDHLKEDCGNCDNCLQPPETYDATEDVNKALSCVYRCGQNFGAVHIIDVLRGSENEKVRQFRHNQLSTYGIGKDLSVNEWRSIFRQLVAQGFLEVDLHYGSLRLNENCRPLLRGEQSLSLRKDVVLAKGDGSSRASKALRESYGDLREEDQAFWAALRKCRRDIAEAHGVPPYVIFHDAALREMLEKRPNSKEEMLLVNGVGDRKLEQYGEAFLAVIAEYDAALG